MIKVKIEERQETSWYVYLQQMGPLGLIHHADSDEVPREVKIEVAKAMLEELTPRERARIFEKERDQACEACEAARVIAGQVARVEVLESERDCLEKRSRRLENTVSILRKELNMARKEIEAREKELELVIEDKKDISKRLRDLRAACRVIADEAL